MSTPEHPPAGQDGVRPRVNLRKFRPSQPPDPAARTRVNLAKTPPPAGPPLSNTTSAPPPPHGAPRGAGPVGASERSRFSPALLAIVGVGAAAVVAFGGFLILGGTDPEDGGGNIQPSAERSSVLAPPGGATTSASAAPTIPEITFDSMRDFVFMHYADLPANPAATWTRLDPHFVTAVGWEDYASFWSTIDSVRVNSVTPRGPDSVFVRLTYVQRDGRTNTEDRWLSFVSTADGLRVYDSERIRSVS